MSLKPKTYPVLEQAIDAGVYLGYNRAYKHLPDGVEMSKQQLCDSIIEAVLQVIEESFHIDD